MSAGRRWTIGILVVTAAIALLAASHGGPDFRSYARWSQAIVHGDPALLGGPERAPTGMPLSQWSHGPGTYFAIPRLLSRETGDGDDAALAAGWLAALAFWGLAVAILWRLANGDPTLTLLGVGLLAVATHAGHYTIAHASESLAYGFLGVLGWQAVRPGRPRTVDLLFVGAATAGLLLVRSYYGIYALPALLRAAAGLHVGPRRIVGLAAIALPGSVAVFQLGWVNRWMTGDPLTPAYDFGDGAFRSLDLLRPDFATVLLHPWHGLLAYHPFYLFGLVALVAIALRAPGRGIRMLALAAVVAVTLNLWIQSSWYVWWLGTATFGMRGMAPAALPVVAASIWCLSRRPFDRTGWRAAAACVVAACSVWSFLLLRLGNTQLYTTDALVRTLAASAADLLAPGALIVWILGAAIGWGLQSIGSRRADVKDPLAWVAAAGSGWISLWLLGAAGNRLSSATLAPRLFLAILPVLALGALWLIASSSRRTRPPSTPTREMADALSGLVVAGFFAASALFAAYAYRVEVDTRPDYDAARERGRTLQLTEIRASLREYEAVEGYEAQRQRLRDFLDRVESAGESR